MSVLEGEPFPGVARNLVPLRIFQREVQHQCEYAAIALMNLAAALEANAPAVHVWDGLQAFLSAAARVSLLFWNPRERIKGRGKELRKTLGVSGNSPLENRKLRNAFTHFDKELDDWTRGSRRKNFVDGIIGPPGAVVGGVDPRDVMRSFEPAEFKGHFRGQEFELEPMALALQEIWLRARVESERPGLVLEDEAEREPEPEPYVPVEGDPRPFSEALVRIKGHQFGGNIKSYTPKPPPDPPTRHDSTEVLRKECNKVVRPLLQFVQERAERIPSIEWPLVKNDTAAFTAWSREGVSLYNEYHQRAVEGLYERLKENGWWDEPMEGLYARHDLDAFGAVEVLAQKLEHFCEQVVAEKEGGSLSG